MLSLFTLLSFCTLSAPRPYDVTHYRIDVKVFEQGHFEATTTLSLKTLRKVSSLEFDAYGLRIESAEVGSIEAPFTTETLPGTQTGRVRMSLPRALAAHRNVAVTFRYRGQARTSHDGFFSVPNPDRDGALPSFFTHFQPHHAQLFFPNNEDPSDKATSEILAEVDGRYEVLSNGERVSDETFSRNGQLRRRSHWKQSLPHSSYLLALAIGEFESVDVKSKVPARIWVARGKGPQADFAADYTAFALQFQEDFLGVKYPWHKFDQVAVPRFIWGGMENTSLVFNRESGLLLEEALGLDGRPRISGLVAHELAHQWFGDFVTCRTWADTWLNEGFATWLSGVTEKAYYRNEYVALRRAVGTFVDYFRHEDGPRARPLGGRKGPAQDVFDAVSYQKGAHVLRMLESLVGQEEFRQSLKEYLERYALGSVTSTAFFDSVARSTGRPMEVRAFQKSWLEKKGYPVLTVRWRYEKGKIALHLRQRPNRSDEKGPFSFLLPVVIHGKTEPRYQLTHWLTISKPETEYSFEVPGEPGWVNWNKEGTALARIEAGSVLEEEWILASQHESDAVWQLFAFWELMAPLLQPGPEQAPSEVATRGLLKALASDEISPFVKEAALTRLAHGPRRRLPAEWNDVVLSLARRATGASEEEWGEARLRKAALQLLGKLDSPDGRQYLLENLAQPRMDLGTLSALAIGAAKLGDARALAALKQGVELHARRGYPYYRAMVEALGAVENVDTLPAIWEQLRIDETNNELFRGVLSRLHDNQTVKQSNALGPWVKRLVLGETIRNEELQSRVLKLLDDVKTPSAREALEAISRESTSERLRANARDCLLRNFPPEGREAAVGE